jgi:Cupredoxin-like domain
MRRSLLPAVVLAFFSVGALGFDVAQDAAPWEAGTPRPEGSPPASPAASPPACPEDSLPGRLVAVPNEVTIRLTDEGFDPGTIQTTNNTDLAVTLVNSGTRAHSFVLEDLGVDVELRPGESQSLALRPVDGGDAVTHTFYSDAPGDECMRGVLIFYI